MRTVSNDFKSAVTSYGRQIAGRVTIGTQTYGADTIVSAVEQLRAFVCRHARHDAGIERRDGPGE